MRLVRRRLEDLNVHAEAGERRERVVRWVDDDMVPFDACVQRKEILHPQVSLGDVVGLDAKGRPLVSLLRPNSRFERVCGLWRWSSEWFEEIDARGEVVTVSHFRLAQRRVVWRVRSGDGSVEVSIYHWAQGRPVRRDEAEADHTGWLVARARTAAYTAQGELFTLRCEEEELAEGDEMVPTRRDETCLLGEGVAKAALLRPKHIVWDGRSAQQTSGALDRPHSPDDSARDCSHNVEDSLTTPRKSGASAAGGPFSDRCDEDKPLDSALVTDLAAGTPLAELAIELSALARPALRAIADPLESEGLRTSRIGGRPDLPTGMAWPLFESDESNPFAFVAQLDLAELDPAIWFGPRDGLLSIFCAIVAEYMGIDGPGRALVIHHAGGVALEPRDPPNALDSELVFPERRVTFVPELTLPDVSVEPAAVLSRFGFGYDEPREQLVTDLHKLRERVATHHDQRHRLARVLGWPELVQADVMPWLAAMGAAPDEREEVAEARHPDWTLLLQCDVEDPRVYVGLPTIDLAAGRFDRAQALTDSD